MRFYKNRQAEMLHWVSNFLNEKREKLSSKVPAMKDFIDEFLKQEAALYAISIGNPNVVKKNTLEKQSTRKAFVTCVAKLIAVLDASGFKLKNKPLPEMEYSVYELSKMPAEKLCQTYLKVYGAVKKVRNLQYYGLAEGDMRDMQAYYQEFSAIKNAPRVKKKEVALSNKKLNDGVKDCISFLEKHIDKMMLIAAADEPALQMDYKALRKVLPRASGRPSDAEAAYRKSRERKQE